MPEAADLPWEATFVENITRARKAVDMSQTEFAKRVAAFGLPFHQQTVQRIEAGERPVRLNEAMVICDVLNMDDLASAIFPKSVEKATAFLLAQVEQVENEALPVAFEVEVVAARTRALTRQMQTERAVYMRALASLGHDADEQLVDRAEHVIARWFEVEEQLKAISEELKRHVVRAEET